VSPGLGHPLGFAPQRWGGVPIGSRAPSWAMGCVLACCRLCSGRSDYHRRGGRRGSIVRPGSRPRRRRMALFLHQPAICHTLSTAQYRRVESLFLSTASKLIDPAMADARAGGRGRLLLRIVLLGVGDAVAGNLLIRDGWTIWLLFWPASALRRFAWTIFLSASGSQPS